MNEARDLAELIASLRDKARRLREESGYRLVNGSAIYGLAMDVASIADDIEEWKKG